ncbi:DUF4259 domain-containing protein [Streptomyces kanamyceticus]|uniref:DUF4259 domain-containing protein n=1 Tax=Streptomyces kanamyceticus TaxID=1967 RepID=A0A5J6GNE6_STRKN|nr:DUF4259 domain-containing protein [Streptomyces kanamyceticus]QEU96929.1 DUF4259 domain-containing protein [Streptomyces kanamyceticus]
MGTWDVGPFDNDTAADFCDALDQAAADKRETIIHGTITRVIGAAGYLEAPESEEAVAAAALIAAPCRGGQPADPHDGPEEPIPDLTHLRAPALQALDRIMTEPSELRDLCAEPIGGFWRATISRLRTTLNPPSPGEQLRWS